MTEPNSSPNSGNYAVNDSHCPNGLDLRNLFAEAIAGRENCPIIGEISAKDLLPILASALEENEGE